jgi:hypothetical protein
VIDVPLYEVLEEGELCPAGATVYPFGFASEWPIVYMPNGRLCLLLIRPETDLSRPVTVWDVFGQSLDGVLPLNTAAINQILKVRKLGR